MTTIARPTLPSAPTRPATAAGRRDRPQRLHDPTALAVACATAYLEIRAGRRPARQLDRLLSPLVRLHLAAVVTHHRGARRRCGDVSVLRVVTSHGGPGLVDAVVVARDGASHTAVAVRIEYRPDGWKVTALGTPEDAALFRRRDSA